MSADWALMSSDAPNTRCHSPALTEIQMLTYFSLTSTHTLTRFKKAPILHKKTLYQCFPTTICLQPVSKWEKLPSLLLLVPLFKWSVPKNLGNLPVATSKQATMPHRLLLPHGHLLWELQECLIDGPSRVPDAASLSLFWLDKGCAG